MIPSIIEPVFGQNSFNTIQITDKNVQIKTTSSSQSFFDINNISDISKDLFNSKLNLSLSESKLTSSGLDFDLIFSSNSSEKLNAKGYYKTKEQTIGVSLNYEFQKEVIVNGEVKTQTFEAVIDLKASISEHIPANPREKKPDVINFVQRVVSEVLSSTHNEAKVLKGFTLDKEELGNILELEDEKVANHIQNLIELALVVGKYKRSPGLNNNSNVTGIESNTTKNENPSINQNITLNEFKVRINPIDITKHAEKRNDTTI